MIAQEIMGSIANLPTIKRNLRCYQLCKDGALRVYDTSWCFVTLLRASDFYSTPPARHPTITDQTDQSSRWPMSSFRTSVQPSSILTPILSRSTSFCRACHAFRYSPLPSRCHRFPHQFSQGASRLERLWGRVGEVRRDLPLLRREGARRGEER